MKRYEFIGMSHQQDLFRESPTGPYIRFDDPAIASAVTAMSFGGEGPWSNILLHNAGGILIEYGTKENLPQVVEMGKALKLKGEKEHKALAGLKGPG